MKTIIVGMTGVVAAMLAAGPAGAWSHANSMGGSTSHSYGSTSHTNAYGGSTQHAYGEGTEHTNAYGGSTAHGWDGGTTHTNVAGGTTTGAYGAGAVHTTATGYSTYHPPYPATGAYAPYHPPVAVPYYASGCYNCGGAAAAGAVVGMATGRRDRFGQHGRGHVECVRRRRCHGQRRHRGGVLVGLRGGRHHRRTAVAAAPARRRSQARRRPSRRPRPLTRWA